ncbi:transposable element Tc1 transposase [Trichonephila clavipes]|nr:transposable element Tc1 transposase [Trichonephila clavipes]
MNRKDFRPSRRNISYRAIGARVHRNSSTVMRVGKQWTEEYRTTRKTGSGRRKGTSAYDYGHLLRMAVNDRKTSSKQLTVCWSTGKSVLMSASSISRRLMHRGLRAKVLLYRIPSRQTIDDCVCNWLMSTQPGKLIGNKCFLDESRFKLWNHDGRIRVIRYAGELCFSECVIERHSDLTPAVIVWGAISYHERSNLLRIEGNLKSNRYVVEVRQPEVVPVLQGMPGAIFQQDKTRPHFAKTARVFCSAHHMQLLSWSAYSPDMSPIEQVWDLVGRCLTRDPRPAASKDELLLRIASNIEFSSTSRHPKSV